jgi:hypothetical protein
VKREKAEQPQNNQNCGDNPKHVVISLRVERSNSAQKTE